MTRRIEWGGLWALGPHAEPFAHIADGTLDWKLVFELLAFVDGQRSDQLYVEGTEGDIKFVIIAQGGAGGLMDLSIGWGNAEGFHLLSPASLPSDDAWVEITSGGNPLDLLKRHHVPLSVADHALRSFAENGYAAFESGWEPSGSAY